MACLPQIPIVLGGMGGARWSPMQAVNLHHEMGWLGIGKKRQADVAAKYRVIEAEALRILSERTANQAQR